MRSLILSKCRDLRMGVTYVDLGALTTARATEFWIAVAINVPGPKRAITLPECTFQGPQIVSVPTYFKYCYVNFWDCQQKYASGRALC